MRLISDLSILAGAGMIAAGIAMIGLEWHLARKSSGSCPGAPGRPLRENRRGPLALLLLGWGPILLALGCVTFPGWQLGSSR